MSGTHWLFLLALLPAFFVSPASGQELSPGQLLDAYEQSLDNYRQMAFTVEMKVSYEGFALPRGTLIEESQYQIWRDGERWKEIMAGIGRRPVRRKIHTSSDGIEILMPSQGSIWVGLDPIKRTPQAVLARLDELPPYEALLIRGMHFNVGTCGQIGRTYLPMILKESTLSARRERLAGKGVWVLEGQGRWGRLALWLDPELGFVPRRIEERKGSEDWIMEGQTVGSLEGTGDLWPHARRTEMNMLMEAEKIETIRGVPVMTEFTLTDDERFAFNKPVVMREHIRFTHVEIRPDFSRNDPFVITTPIPNGMPVSVEDRHGIQYEWQNGQIVKAINQDSVKALEGYTFTPGKWWNQKQYLLYILGMLALIAIALTLGWRLRSRQRAREGR